MPTSIPYIRPEIDGLTSAQLSARLKESGLCSGVNNDDWFPQEPTTAHGRLDYERQARRQCAGCPVKSECLLLALRHESRKKNQHHGVWGGTAPWQRKAMLRRLRRNGGMDAARAALGVAS